MKTKNDNALYRDFLKKERTKTSLKYLINLCYNDAVKAGWYTDINTGEPTKRPVPEVLCLIHSEISEALEAWRKDLKDDKLPHHDGYIVELCDALIRIFDTLGAHGKLEETLNAFVEKIEYNRNREDHKVENRLKENGKKI